MCSRCFTDRRVLSRCIIVAELLVLVESACVWSSSIPLSRMPGIIIVELSTSSMNIVVRAALGTFRMLTNACQRRMSFLSLLDKPKKPSELSPVFKLPERLKGHSRSKIVSKTKSRKMRGWCRIMKPRLHNHNGLMKRIRIVMTSDNDRWVPDTHENSSSSALTKGIYCETSQGAT